MKETEASVIKTDYRKRRVTHTWGCARDYDVRKSNLMISGIMSFCSVA